MRSCVTAACVVLLAWAAAETARAADPPDKGGAFPDLVAALQATPGCLGVETAQTSSGKQVIFAWFENKKAALNWYYSDTHRDIMKRVFPDFKRTRRPLADVPDDGGPIMAVASVTPAGKPTKENPLPLKQIAIELYRPLGGGLSIGGRFAPEAMKVPPARAEKPEK